MARHWPEIFFSWSPTSTPPHDPHRGRFRRRQRPTTGDLQRDICGKQDQEGHSQKGQPSPNSGTFGQEKLYRHSQARNPTLILCSPSLMAKLLVLVLTMLPAACLIYVQTAKSIHMLVTRFCVISHRLPSNSLFASSHLCWRLMGLQNPQ